MHFIKAIAASLSLACLVSCSDVDLHARQSPGTERIVQIVTVGDDNGSFKFFPEQVVAEPGSVVQFQFYPKNHTVTESSFAAPCVPIAANLTSEQRPGQKSGFVPVTPDIQFRPVYNLIVNDTKPMWIYCGQTTHCQRGMAMVINQNMTDPNKTLEKYKAAAAAIQVPGASPSASSAPAPPGQATTVTPAGNTATGNPAGPSPTTSQTATGSASISSFTPGPNAAYRQVPAAAMLGLAAGVVGVFL